MTTKDFTVDIIGDADYNPNSIDNARRYDNVYIDDSEFRPTSRHGIRISRDGIELTSVIFCETGGATGIHSNSFIIQEDNIFLCCCDKIYSFALPDLKLNWTNKLDTATCFGIHPFHDDFIIHGELEVKRIDKQGNIKWDFCAKDIFVTQDGSDSLRIKDNKIELTDWGGEKYVLDENGRMMAQRA